MNTATNSNKWSMMSTTTTMIEDNCFGQPQQTLPRLSCPLRLNELTSTTTANNNNTNSNNNNTLIATNLNQLRNTFTSQRRKNHTYHGNIKYQANRSAAIGGNTTTTTTHNNNDTTSTTLNLVNKQTHQESSSICRRRFAPQICYCSRCCRRGQSAKMHLHNQPTGGRRRWPSTSVSLSIISQLLVCFTLVTCLSTAAVDSTVLAPPDQAPIFSPSGHYPPLSVAPVGPSLCPLVPVCQCKWSNGKQGASCEKRNLANIPAQLPQDTQVLEMSGNNIGQLAPHIFQDMHLTNLQKIYLQDCRITHIADNAFAHLTNLIELDLSHNNIQFVPVKAFQGNTLKRLAKLSLANNPIKTIEADSFSSLTQLTTLDLSNCQLEHMRGGAFGPGQSLSSLKELKLNDNRLSQLPMNVISDLRRDTPIVVDLYGNPWHCDCDLRQSIEWMARNHVQQSMIPTCSTPQRHKDIRWHNVRQEEFICPPVVISSYKQNELIVGAGSNVSLACTARGSPPLTFVWFQDEKNLTTVQPANVSDPPASTKLLEERRYEIAEDIGPPGPPNTTTSTLYLYNLKLSDTSLFLCWVENAAGYTLANFSLIVNDSPPAHRLAGGAGVGGNLSANSGGGFPSLLGLNPGEAQMGIISILFVIVLVAAIVFLLMFKHSSGGSGKDDTQKSGSDNHLKSSTNHHTISSISASNKFSNHHQHKQMLTDSESDDNNIDDGDCNDTDADHSSSGSNSSCHKNPKVMSTSDLDGFIEHMRSGIINMDYHSMSPVIQFNNSPLKSSGGIVVGNGGQEMVLARSNNNQQSTVLPPYLATSSGHSNQAMHHFPSASNASSSVPPYYCATNTGSMATTTSDLSPSGSGSGSGSNTNFNQHHQLNNHHQHNINNHHQHANNNGQHHQPNHLTNCDLQHQLNDMGAPATNTTTTSYTSDYQSGNSEDPSNVNINNNNMMPPMYYETNQQHSFHHQTIYPNQHLIAAGNGSQQQMRPNSLVIGHPQQHQQLSPAQQQQQGGLVLQDMMHNNGRLLPPNQRLRLDNGFHIL